MSAKYQAHVGGSMPIKGREKEMMRNHEGAHVFKIDPFASLARFLILGAAGGTYYANEQKQTQEMFDELMICINTDPKRTIDMAVDVSVHGRAKDNDPALFVLAAAMAYASVEFKHYARTKLSTVARIGTHILHFADMINTLKGWGMGTRKAFKSWFLDQEANQLAYQAIKYGQRDGWSLRDLLRKSHPYGDQEQNAVFNYIAKGDIEGNLPDIIYASEKIKTASEKEAIALISEYNIPREAVPTALLSQTEIWEALLPRMGLTALIRNLSKMTSLGMMGNKAVLDLIVSKMLNTDSLKKDRIHPLFVLNAFKAYCLGHGVKGSLAWAPCAQISEALEEAFYRSFEYVEPTGKTRMICLDASSSMTWEMISGTAIKPREASACMAMVTARSEALCLIKAFSGTLVPVEITAKSTLDEAMLAIARVRAGTTNCSAPMLFALDNKLDVDSFEVYTDNETCIGSVPPATAVQMYRDSMSKPYAKLAVIAMTATKFSIADPKDPGMIDIVGFDTSTPSVLSEFIRF